MTMDFSPQNQPQPEQHIHIPRFVFTGIIAGALALFIGVMYFMYNMQQDSEAARRTMQMAPIYKKRTPSPTRAPSITSSPEEKMVDDIMIQDPSNELNTLEQEAAGL